MVEAIKRRIIKELIDEIKGLEATHLELVGHNVISLIEGRRMIHHGINKDYRPSSYTVDSFSDDFEVVGEYSTESDYFSDASKKDDDVAVYPKIEKDVNHALTHSGKIKPKKIYLISSQEEPPSFRMKFNETKISEDHRDIIEIVDSRELAKLIYKQSILLPKAASYFKLFFPTFSQNLDHFEYYGKVPSFCKNHVSDVGTINMIDDHFSGVNKICVLNGISGSGKTQMAIDYVHNKEGSFENALWISGDDWKENTSLASIQRTRGGTPINIEGFFNTHSTLLVIDDLKRTVDVSDLEELKEGFSIGSKVLITSQLSNVGNAIYLSIPEFSEESLYNILGEEGNSPSEHCKGVISLCKSSPLILATIRNIIEDGGVGKEELYREVIDNPSEVAGNDGRSIMGRILSKLDDSRLVALTRIANSGSTINDTEFLKELIGILNINGLNKLSLILSSHIPGFFKIHDLVKSSLSDEKDLQGFSSAFQKYLSRNNSPMPPNVIRQIHLSSDKLVEVYRSNTPRKTNWITYALLQIEGEQRDEVYNTHYHDPFENGMDVVSIRCLIDAREAYSYTIDEDKRKDFYKSCIAEYDQVLDKSSDDDIKLELLHHQGKAYRRIKQYDKALSCFSSILESAPSLHATYLQIGHLGSQWEAEKSIKEEGEKHLRSLIEFMIDDYTKVPLRVSLGAIARLRSYRILSNEISSDPSKVEILSKILKASSFEGFSQFYEAFVSFTSLFSYHHGTLCIELIEAIPEILTYDIRSIKKYNWINACEAYTNISIAATREGKEELSEKTTRASISFADKVFGKNKLTKYEGRALTKAYTQGGLFKQALESINKVPEKEHDHWLIYRKAEAQLNSKDHDAYYTALMALELAEKDEGGKERISIYHDLISKCAELKGEVQESIKRAKLALENCNDQKYEVALNERYERLKSGET